MMDPKTDQPSTLRIPYEELRETFLKKLLQYGFPAEGAATCARLFADNTLDGVFSHGINRFPRFVEYIRDGYVKPKEEPVLVASADAMEQWDGRLGAGPLNALICTDRAMELSQIHGIGCVALANTNHWMRGGAYAWKAAGAGFAFLGWTNTIANMPAWGARDCRLGNNPLVIGVPYEDEAVVLDMAMSQFSYGTMEAHSLQNRQLPLPGGYDAEGKLSTDPAAILSTQRPLPGGYWKGAGLSLLLDILATTLSGGRSVFSLSQNEVEYGLSQVFIAIDISKLSHYAAIGDMLRAIIQDYKRSQPATPGQSIVYPGERAPARRVAYRREGIPVDKGVWERIRKL